MVVVQLCADGAGRGVGEHFRLIFGHAGDEGWVSQLGALAVGEAEGFVEAVRA